MEDNASQDTDEKDLAVLLESLRSYETLDPRTLREVFGIIRSLLSKNRKVQDNFRELQGIALLMNLYIYYNRTKNTKMIGHVVYTLGVATEQNDETRDALMSAEIFTMVKEATKLSLVSSTFLLLCLTSNNVAGQDLSRTTHCLHKMCTLLKKYLTEQEESNKILLTSCDALCTSICAMITNPINKNNQDVCCRLLLPTLVKTPYQDINCHILQSLINLMGSCIIDNSDCQKTFCVIGGIRALATLLSKCLSFDTVENNTIADKTFMMHLVNTLSCSYTNNSANKVQVIELDVIENLLDCLQTYTIYGRDCKLQITCVSALLNLFVESNNNVVESGKQRLQESGGIAILIQLLTTQDEMLKKLVTALLQRTFNKEALPASDKKTNKTTTETVSKRSHIPENEGCEVSSSFGGLSMEAPGSSQINDMGMRKHNTYDYHDNGRATVNHPCHIWQDELSKRKSDGPREKIDVTKSDGEKCADKSSKKDKTTKTSANNITAVDDYQQISLTQRNTSQPNDKYSSNKTTKDCDQAAKKDGINEDNCSILGTTLKRVTTRPLDSQTAVSDTAMYAEEHYITPKKRATASLIDRSASTRLENSNRSQQRALADRFEPGTDNKPEQEGHSRQKHKMTSTDKAASTNTRRATSSMRHNKVYLDEEVDMELSEEYDSEPAKVPYEGTKGMHQRTNRRLGRAPSSTTEISQINGHRNTRNTPLSDHSPEEEAGATPRTKQTNTNTRRVTETLAETFAVNDDTPLSVHHSLSQRKAKATPRIKQISSNTKSSKSYLVHDHNLLRHSPGEKTDREILSNKRERVVARNLKGDCCCGVIPFIDSHNALTVLKGGAVCVYHKRLGCTLSRYLTQMLSQLEEHS